jgi:hypothetical protein
MVCKFEITLGFSDSKVWEDGGGCRDPSACGNI